MFFCFVLISVTLDCTLGLRAIWCLVPGPGLSLAMSHKLTLSLFRHSFQFYTIIAQAHLRGTVDCRLRHLWLGW